MNLFLSLDSFFFLNISIFTISFFLIFSLCFNIRFSTNQDYGFPVLLKSSSLFTYFFLVLSLLLFGSDFIFSDSLYFFNQNFQLIFLVVASFVVLACLDYNSSRSFTKFEFDFLILCVFLSAVCLCFADDFLIFYLAIEFQSLAFYILSTFDRNSEFSTEAGLKYFVFGAVFSCFLLIGFALIFLAFGSASFELLFSLVLSHDDPFFFSGVLFLTFALLFKVGSAPFHFWLADVYDGSILNVTMLFASAPKLILFSILVKLFLFNFFELFSTFEYLFLFCCLSSITVGAISAIYQKRVKRLFAYSTISHTGFILLGLLVNNAESSKALITYISIYALLSVLLFSFLVFSTGITNNNVKYLINWTAFGIKNYTVAITFSLIIFSIAGIPPLAGFFSKFFILLSAISNEFFLSCFFIIFVSSIGCFFYIRLIKIFFFSKTSKNSFWLATTEKKNTNILLVFLFFFNLFFFCRPDLLSYFSTVVCFCLV